MNRIAFVTALAGFAMTATTANAEIVAQAEHGFSSRHGFTVGAPPDAVWAELIAPSQWWNGAHSWSGDAKNLSLNPTAGGCFCEIWIEDGERHEVEHLRVVSVLPEQNMTLRGALGPLQALGVTGALSFSLTPGEKSGTTDLTVVYNVGGFIDDLDQWAPAVDGVIAEQANRLVTLVETGFPGTDYAQPAPE